MDNHYQLSDQEFIAQFANCSLPPSLFTHEAHLRLAWVLISTYGLEAACPLSCQHIKNFDIVHGDGSKFNTTVTIAATKVVYHFIQKSQSSTFQDFIQEFPRLKYNFRELLDCHYGFDIFSSIQAKTAYLAPDLLPFDWLQLLSFANTALVYEVLYFVENSNIK